MAIERYKGTIVIAEDASELIDINTINDGCNLMNQAAKKLEEITAKIVFLQEKCNRNTLSINNTNLENVIKQYEQNTRSFYKYIYNLSNQIQTTSTRIKNRKQVILNEEAKQLEKQKRKKSKKRNK